MLAGANARTGFLRGCMGSIGPTCRAAGGFGVHAGLRLPNGRKVQGPSSASFGLDRRLLENVVKGYREMPGIHREILTVGGIETEPPRRVVVGQDKTDPVATGLRNVLLHAIDPIDREYPGPWW